MFGNTSVAGHWTPVILVYLRWVGHWWNSNSTHLTRTRWAVCVELLHQAPEVVQRPSVASSSVWTSELHRDLSCGSWSLWFRWCRRLGSSGGPSRVHLRRGSRGRPSSSRSAGRDDHGRGTASRCRASRLASEGDYPRPTAPKHRSTDRNSVTLLNMPMNDKMMRCEYGSHIYWCYCTIQFNWHNLEVIMIYCLIWYHLTLLK